MFSRVCWEKGIDFFVWWKNGFEWGLLFGYDGLVVWMRLYEGYFDIILILRILEEGIKFICKLVGYSIMFVLLK